MKKRLLAVLLAVSILPSAAAQAAGGSLEHFQRSETYGGQFSDLAAESVFYDNVTALYEYGLSVGKEDGTFGLKDPLTVNQVLIFAARIRSLYKTGAPERGPDRCREKGQAVHEPYLRYLQKEKVVGTELDGALGTNATRAQVAHVLAGTLPPEALPEINAVLVQEGYESGRFIPDVTGRTPYARDILRLYRAGICVGSDQVGRFLPDQLITRGAAAAMLTRMADPELRMTPQWDMMDLWSAKGTAMKDLIRPGAYISEPVTDEEMDETVRHMLSRGENVLHLQYGSASAATARKVMEQALSTVKVYVEQCYNSISCVYTPDGAITLTFSAASAGDRLQEYRAVAMEAAIAVHDGMWQTRTITPDMTDMEKARVYYDWVCGNCVYDFGASPESLSHIAYSLFQNGTAVCDGYTGAYNLLLKLEGIPCAALSNSEHIWTVALLDGKEYHIDTTWGDSGSQVNERYFAMTAQEAREVHRWGTALPPMS